MHCSRRLSQTLNVISEVGVKSLENFSQAVKSYLQGNTVGPPYLWVPNLDIQPTTDRKYSKISRKFQKAEVEFAMCQQLFT